MTSTSPALLPTPAGRIEHTGTLTGHRHREPGSESGPNLQSPDLQSLALQSPNLQSPNLQSSNLQSPDPQSPDPQSAFELHLSHHHELLYFVAFRILNCPQEAEEAVKNCLRTAASRNPPDSSSEGAFKSWLVRILIDEATLLLRKQQSNPSAKPAIPSGPE